MLIADNIIRQKPNSKYLFQPVKDDYFSIYYSIYGTNIYMDYHWKELLDHFSPNGNGTLIFKDSVPIGGITINNNRFSSPFLIPPFCDIEEFWQAVINHLEKDNKNDILYFDNIPVSHADILSSLGGTKRWAQRRMYRPTAEYNIKPNDNLYFTIPLEVDKDEIIHVVYEAHQNGYTSTLYGKPDISDIGQATNRRFISFSQTNTLHFGTIVKTKYTNKIVAVCIAGIYPDSQNDFSTIHQVSVLPGNPAELLYQKLGFIAGPAYYYLTYEK